MKPFDVIATINEHNPLDNDVVMAYYNPFLTDLNFAGTLDTVFIANEANKLNNLPIEYRNEMLYHFYINMVEKNPRRYAKWLKRDREEEIKQKVELLVAYYDISKREALEVVELHTEEQYNIMKEFTFTGGVSK